MDGVSPSGCKEVSYLDVLDELLGRCVDGSFGVDDVLDRVGPACGLIEQLTVETVRVFTAVHNHIPVACQGDHMRRNRKKHVTSKEQLFLTVRERSCKDTDISRIN